MVRLLLIAVLVGSALTALAKDRALYVAREITADDLAGRSLRELTLMRNWVYAKRGNEFRKRWLKQFFSEQTWYKPDQRAFLNGEWRNESEDTSNEWGRDDLNAERIAEYESALTIEQLSAMRDAARAEKSGNAIELRLLSVRLGGWAGEGAAPADLTPLENPKRLATLLKLTDLDDLSPRDLKLLRNTIFARRGRVFETPLVKGHFKTIEWYRPNPEYSDALLNDIDKKNVKLIQSLERQLKRENEPNFMLGA